MMLCSEAFSVLHSVVYDFHVVELWKQQIWNFEEKEPHVVGGGETGVQISMHPGHLDEQHM